jgi:ribosomal protein S18 acetylase RimI-like enzyme
MNHIQTDVSDEALVTAIRSNLGDFFKLVSRNSPEEQPGNGRFTRWYSPLQHPWFNGVLSSSPFEAEDDAFIEATIQHFRAKRVSTFTWWMEPHLKPSDWGPALSKHGFGFDNGTPGMAVDLQALNESIGTVDGLEVRAVADEESLHTWAKIFIAGYGLPSDWENTVFDEWLKLGLEFPLKNYLGYINDEPVSTACLFYGGGAAGIYSVSTLPKARGRGIGAAVTLKPLLDAREKGYRVGVLQSSEMGFNIYKKLGFRHLCQIENFYLSLK